jgi:hypothetical protein
MRIPSLTDIGKIPFLPVVTGIIGQHEPYGGRTGLVMTIFVPATIVTWFLMDRAYRDRLLFVAVPAAGAYLAAAVLLVRTRFLLTPYSLALAGAVVTVQFWRQGARHRVAEAVLWSFRLAVIVGMADGARRAWS